MRALSRAPSRRGQRGQILILTGLTLIVLIGAVGLAVDAGRAYGVKARLNAAVDAASIAAARAIAQGADEGARIANAQAAAVRFFNLNYPADFLSSTPSAPTTVAVHESDGRWRVRVSATAEMPTTFMRVLGRTEFNVAAMGEAVRRDLDVILVMDTSGSIGADFPTLQLAAKNSFVNKFTPGVGGDRLGLVTFASGAWLDVPIDKTANRGFDRPTVVNAINSLTEIGPTASAEGMRKALDELNLVPAVNRSSLRVILLFSDGAPNIINGTFLRSGGTVTDVGNLDGSYLFGPVPYKPGVVWPPNQRYVADTATFYTDIVALPSQGSGTIPLASFDNRRTFTGASFPQPHPYENTKCNASRAARNMLENVANMARGQDIRVYSIGLGNRLTQVENPYDLDPSAPFDCGYNPTTETGSAILKRVANTADSGATISGQPQGLYCHAASGSELDRCFSTIASEILRLTL